MLRRRKFGTVVLMYHRLGRGVLAGRASAEEAYAVLPESFERQLDILQQTRCEVVPLAEAGSSPAGPRVALTFDDGNASDRLHAAPRLVARGLSATFFVTPAFVGGPDYLSWEQARELAELGMEIGSHGWDHRPLGRLPLDELRAQLADSKNEIEARLGRPCLSISLPNGSGGARELALARELGYRIVAGSVPRRLLAASRDEPLPRFALRSADPLPWFRAVVEQRPLALARVYFRYAVLQAARNAVGEDAYARVRNRWAGARADRAA